LKKIERNVKEKGVRFAFAVGVGGWALAAGEKGVDVDHLEQAALEEGLLEPSLPLPLPGEREWEGVEGEETSSA
jgi:hypothetical protein